MDALYRGGTKSTYNRLMSIRAAMVVFALLPALCRAEDFDSLKWKPLPAKPAAHRELIDCRSPIITHENRIKLGETMTLGDHRLTFTLDGKRIGVSHQTGGASDAKARTQALGPSPAGYFFDAFKSQYGLSIRVDADGNTSGSPACTRSRRRWAMRAPSSSTAISTASSAAKATA